MKPESQIMAVHMAARDYKEYLIKEFGAPSDVAPSVRILFKSGRQWLGTAAEGFSTLLDRSVPVFDIVGAGIRAKWVEMDRVPILVIQFVCEGFLTEEQIEEYEHGDMEKDFRNNPDSPVRECLSTYHFEHDGFGGVDMWSVTDAYQYTDGGELRWGARFVVPSDHKTKGALVDAFTALMQDLGGEDV